MLERINQNVIICDNSGGATGRSCTESDELSA